MEEERLGFGQMGEMGGEDERKVIGCAASPTNVTLPSLLSQLCSGRLGSHTLSGT